QIYTLSLHDALPICERVGYTGEAGVVVVGDRVLQPIQMIGLDPAPDLDRVVHAPQLVDVAHEVDVGTDRLAHDADALDRRRDRRLAPALHLHLSEAHVPQARARLGEVVDRMRAHEGAARVRR